MEFNFNVQTLLFCNKEGFSVVYLSSLLRNEYENSDQIHQVLSAIRGQLRQKTGMISISSLNELPTNTRIYLKAIDCTCYAYLIVSDDNAGNEKVKLHEFYVAEHYQRMGQGTALFDKMLVIEKVQPSRITYDASTLAFQKFLLKYISHAHQPQLRSPLGSSMSTALLDNSQSQRITIDNNSKNTDLFSNVGLHIMSARHTSSKSNLLNQSPQVTNNPLIQKNRLSSIDNMRANHPQNYASFTGRRPRPDYISDSFGKHYNLFGNTFKNSSTNPSKYNPLKQEFDFNLDFTLVKRQNPIRNEVPPSEKELLSDTYQSISRGAQSGSYTQREPAGSRLSQSLNARDLIQIRRIDYSSLFSPSKIGKAKVAAIYPTSLQDRIDAVPQAPFATFNREAGEEKYYFRTGDKQNNILI